MCHLRGAQVRGRFQNNVLVLEDFCCGPFLLISVRYCYKVCGPQVLEAVTFSKSFLLWPSSAAVFWDALRLQNTLDCVTKQNLPALRKARLIRAAQKTGRSSFYQKTFSERHCNFPRIVLQDSQITESVSERAPFPQTPYT